MKKLIAILLLLAIQESIVFAQVYYNNPNFNNNYYNRRYYPPAYISTSRDTAPNYIRKQRGLNALEKYSLNKNYNYDNNLNRLERLENLTFGSTQTGNFDTRYRNLENAILSRPPQNSNIRKSFFRNIADYFNGTSTGLSPSFSNNYGYSYSSTDNVSILD